MLICNRVQAAHETGFAPPGHLFPQSEHLPSHFYKLVVELVTEHEGAENATVA